MKKIVICFFVISCSLFKIPDVAGHNISKTCIHALNFALQGKWDQAYAVLPAQSCPLTAEVIQWLDLRDESRPHSFYDYQQFISKHPDWPKISLFRKRAESKINRDVAGKVIVNWYSKNPVLNSKAARYYIEILLQGGERTKARKVVREIWINLDFEPNEEKIFKDAYNKFLTLKDHELRTDRLLWESKTVPAKRMLASLDLPHRLLAQARIALIGHDDNAEQILAKVPKNLRKNPGLIFAQVLNHHKSDNLEGAHLLLAHKARAMSLKEHQKLWWSKCRYFAREALNQGQPLLAYKLIEGHPLVTPEDYAESEWFLGWVALSFLKQPQKSYEHFKHMYAFVKTPLSKAKASYWCGRAAEALGNSKEAQQWYHKASEGYTTYYGQLALAQIDPHRPLKFKHSLPITVRDKQTLEQHEFARIARLFIASGHGEEAKSFLYLLNERAANRGQRFAALELTRELLPTFAVKAVKVAERIELLMVHWAYPLLPFEIEAAVEKALLHSVTRQESDFDFKVISPAGAVGLMQLLPDTAQKIAYEMKIPYKEARLYVDPIYNAHLGGLYLIRKLEQFNGSLVLALASYNAGAKPVREWVKRNGLPPENGIGLVDWIEKIPFKETRTYVQRVLSNLYIYRQLLKGKA